MGDPITAVVAVALITLLCDGKKKQREHDRPLSATGFSQVAPKGVEMRVTQAKQVSPTRLRALPGKGAVKRDRWWSSQAGTSSGSGRAAAIAG